MRARACARLVVLASLGLVTLAPFVLAGCGSHLALLEGEDETNVPSSVAVRRFELAGNFASVAAAAESTITGQGGPTPIRGESQIRFRSRGIRLTLREAEGQLRVELVLPIDTSTGDAQRWQAWFRAIGRMPGVGRRIVNGSPVEDDATSGDE